MIKWAASADKWGISHEDALHAITHAHYSSDDVKVNDKDLSIARLVFIGPQHEHTERLIEVLVEMRRDGFRVYHVMPLGSYYRRQMEDDR